MDETTKETVTIDIEYEKRFLDDFILMLKFYNPELYQKIKQTGEISALIGKEMGVEEPQYYLAGYYANIGLMAMAMLFNKPEHLTDEEYKVISRHPVLASEYLDRRGLPIAADFAYHHHELPDGGGYNKITSFAKEATYINIADVFQGCLTPKHYRPQLTLREAIEAALKPYKQYLVLKKEEVEKIEKVLRAFHGTL